VRGDSASAHTGIVIATRDRAPDLLRTLERLAAHQPGSPVVVVDNGSRDGTPEAVRERFPAVRVLALEANLGAAARNLGARELPTRYVAFNDDDSYWVAGALDRAAARFAARPRLGLVAARVLVGRDERLDPTCAAMAASPLPARPGAPGPAVLGFVACGAIVRRAAFLAAGGFHPRMGVGGEEELLAVDLASAGWELAYVDDVVARHHPAAGDRPGRRTREVRNRLWSAWLRRPATTALAVTGRELRAAARDRDAARGVGQALAGLAWTLRARRCAPAHVAKALALLD
jgi:N-acetylglucosaminyl-diphospho-decaprenol L-rhamnosyltransferase